MANFRPKKSILDPILPKGVHYEDTLYNFLLKGKMKPKLIKKGTKKDLAILQPKVKRKKKDEELY